MALARLRPLFQRNPLRRSMGSSPFPNPWHENGKYKKIITEKVYFSSEDWAHVKNWRFISIFIGFPTVGLFYVNAFVIDHESHDPHPFHPIPYLRIRREKKVPWGDGRHNFFFCPWTNALPEGYEEGHGPIPH